MENNNVNGNIPQSPPARANGPAQPDAPIPVCPGAPVKRRQQRSRAVRRIMQGVRLDFVNPRQVRQPPIRVNFAAPGAPRKARKIRQVNRNMEPRAIFVDEGSDENEEVDIENPPHIS